MKLIYSLIAVLIATSLQAMPTQEELTKADTLIQELMRDDLNAVRNGKKTREQVGDTAFALAKEAQAPAEKYLLLTGAFDQYMRGGSYDKANVSLIALRTAIPDWKHSDEYTLIEKNLRLIAINKGGPVRERYEALKERQQYAVKLKKALAQAEAKPSDKKLQFQLAAYHAALDDWPAALDAFLAGSNPACAAAAKLEKESAAPGQIADAWWSASDIKPDFLSSAIRAHAVDLYKKAIASNSLAGLPKVAAERRIKEYDAEHSSASTPQSASSSSSSSQPSIGMAKYYGVELVGKSIKEDKGVLSGFASGSFGKIKAPFAPKDAPIEAVIEFTTGNSIDPTCGLMGGIGGRSGFTPFYVTGKQLVGYISTTGSSWNIASSTPIGLELHPRRTYRVKCVWNGKEYVWFNWNNGWRQLRKINCAIPVFGGLELQFGTNRGGGAPFSGTIDLNRSYICIDGKLWWEGVKGAYKNANK